MSTALLVAWFLSLVWAVINHIIAYTKKTTGAIIIAQLCSGLYPMIWVLLTTIMLKLLEVL